MNYINTLISDELIYALGWTMVHSLWQSILIALVLAFLMLGLQKQSARVRYLAAYISLFAVLILAILTFTDLYEFTSQNIQQEITLLVKANGIVPNNEESSFFQTFSQQLVYYFDEHLPLLVTGWLIGMAFFLLRFLGGLAYIQHLRYHRNYPLPTHWQTKLEELAERIQLSRPLKLLESSLVKAPLAIGYLKPIILLPIGAINHLSVAQVEAILAHELAHIHRKDYLLNLFQSLIEVIFYYNPAVWWISANIRTERENCCDDIAIELCGSSLTYAKALVSLQELRQVHPGLAMPFSTNKDQLLNRVRRILNQPHNKSNIMEKFTATCMLFVAILLFSISANSPTKQEKAKQAQEITVIDNVANEKDANAFIEILPEKIQAVDTLPKGKTTLKVDRDGEVIEAKVNNGKITYLKIDDREVPKEELEDYEEYVEELIESIPEPIPPIRPVAPPAPIRPIGPTIPPVPAAPQPPLPYPEFQIKSSKKIHSKKDEDGNAFILIESPSGNKIVELKLEKDGAVFLNEEELDLDEEGTTIILDDQIPYIIDGNTFRWEDGDYQERLEDYKEYLKDHDINFHGWNEAFLIKPKLKIIQDQLLQLNDLHIEKHQDLLADVQEKLHDQKEYLNAYSLEALDQLKYLKHLDMDHVNAFKYFNDGNYAYGFFNNGGIVNDEVQDALEQEMLNSGLIEDISSYKLSISSKSLKINGKRQPAAIHKRFVKIYESASGFELGKNSKIVISKNGED